MKCSRRAEDTTAEKDISGVYTGEMYWVVLKERQIIIVFSVKKIPAAES